MALALSSATRRVSKPRFLSAAMSLRIAARMIFRSEPYLSFSTDMFVTMTLSGMG